MNGRKRLKALRRRVSTNRGSRVLRRIVDGRVIPGWFDTDPLCRPLLERASVRAKVRRLYGLASDEIEGWWTSEKQALLRAARSGHKA